jgi:hypothetical protein
MKEKRQVSNLPTSAGMLGVIPVDRYRAPVLPFAAPSETTRTGVSAEI